MYVNWKKKQQIKIEKNEKMYADKAIHVIQMLTTMKSKVITSKDSLECQK